MILLASAEYKNPAMPGFFEGRLLLALVGITTRYVFRSTGLATGTAHCCAIAVGEIVRISMVFESVDCAAIFLEKSFNVEIANAFSRFS